MNQLPRLLSQLGDHELYVCYFRELIGSWRQNPIHNLDDLLEEAQEHLKKLNDPEIECTLNNLFQ
jgi:hypothetical protein